MTLSGSSMSCSASNSGRRYGSIFAMRSPGRKPSRSPASTAGRVRMIRLTSRRDSAAAARRDGQPRLAGARRADAERDRVAADRVDVALLVDALGRDLRRAVAPDDVLEHLGGRRAAVERAGDRADRARRDLVAALDEVGDLARRPRRPRSTASSSPSSVTTLPRRKTSQSTCRSISRRTASSRARPARPRPRWRARSAASRRERPRCTCAGDALAVGAAVDRGHHGLHHGAHVLRRRRAGLGDGVGRRARAARRRTARRAGSRRSARPRPPRRRRARRGRRRGTARRRRGGACARGAGRATSSSSPSFAAFCSSESTRRRRPTRSRSPARIASVRSCFTVSARVTASQCRAVVAAPTTVPAAELRLERLARARGGWPSWPSSEMSRPNSSPTFQSMSSRARRPSPASSRRWYVRAMQPGRRAAPLDAERRRRRPCAARGRRTTPLRLVAERPRAPVPIVAAMLRATSAALADRVLRGRRACHHRVSAPAAARVELQRVGNGAEDPGEDGGVEGIVLGRQRLGNSRPDVNRNGRTPRALASGFARGRIRLDRKHAGDFRRVVLENAPVAAADLDHAAAEANKEPPAELAPNGVEQAELELAALEVPREARLLQP